MYTVANGSEKIKHVWSMRCLLHVKGVSSQATAHCTVLCKKLWYFLCPAGLNFYCSSIRARLDEAIVAYGYFSWAKFLLSVSPPMQHYVLRLHWINHILQKSWSESKFSSVRINHVKRNPYEQIFSGKFSVTKIFVRVYRQKMLCWKLVCLCTRNDYEQWRQNRKSHCQRLSMWQIFCDG